MKLKSIILFLFLTLSFLKVISQPINLDFSAGNISGWNLDSAQSINSILMTTGAYSASSQYSVMLPGNQEVNGIPLTMSSPLGGNFVRIGDPNFGSMAYRLKQQFRVTPFSNSLIVNYAIINQDGSHACSEQPYFYFVVKDSLGNVIGNSNTYLNANGIACSSGDPSFITNGLYHYKDWSVQFVSLQNYVSTLVSVEFIVAGCVISQGAHSGYAYVDADLCSISSSANILSVNTNTYNLNLPQNTINVCGTSTANVIAPTTVSTYTWSGFGISGLNSQNVYLSQLGNYGLQYRDISGCTNPTSVTIIVANNPTVTISSSNSILCVGSSAILLSNGASTYSWSSGASSSSITVTPMVSEVYSVTGTDLNNCSNTQTISITADPTCQDVWPGDANSDGIANNLDILELGLHYIQTGLPRASASNAWQSYFANNWTGTITNGKNLNHSDCNGDGTINDNDTLAIFNNYGLTHTFKPTQTTTVTPQLSIIPDQTAVTKGNWGTASIYLGDVTNTINTINGVAFTVDFDNTLIEPTNIYIEYQNSFLDAGQNLDFRKLDFINSKLFTATTHTVNSNVNGYGKIATLHYQIKSTLTTDEVLNLGISQANQSNASGLITPLTSGTGTLLALGASVGLQEAFNNNFISISPNPTNGLLSINSKTELQKVEVVAITGQILLSETPTNASHTLCLENFANGIYFVNIYQNDRIVKREKIVLNK